MKHRFLSVRTLTGSLLTSALAILGFSACDETEEMYGTPYSTFEVKGTVTDEDGNPVGDAEISAKEGGEKGSPFRLCTEPVRTAINGSYIIRGNLWPSAKLRIVCTPPGNNLEADSVTLDPKYDDSGDNYWNLGHAAMTQNLKLKTKK